MALPDCLTSLPSASRRQKRSSLLPSLCFSLPSLGLLLGQDLHVSCVLVLQLFLDPCGLHVVIFRQSSSCHIGSLSVPPVDKKKNVWGSVSFKDTFKLGCVSSCFQDLSWSAVSPEVPAGSSSRLWSQHEFFGLGFSCQSSDVLRLWVYVLDTGHCFGCYSTNGHLSAPWLNLHKRAVFKKPRNALSL